MNASSQVVAVAPPPFAALIDHELLTRVSLAYVAHRFNLYLRFGEPAYHAQRDRWRRVAAFWPASIFCRIRWEANDYGTVRWQLMVMQACTSMDAVLPLIDAIEALGIAPVDVSPAYWRMLSNRLVARGPLPVYSAERHAAWLTGRALS